MPSFSQWNTPSAAVRKLYVMAFSLALGMPPQYPQKAGQKKDLDDGDNDDDDDLQIMMSDLTNEERIHVERMTAAIVSYQKLHSPNLAVDSTNNTGGSTAGGACGNDEALGAVFDSTSSSSSPSTKAVGAKQNSTSFLTHVSMAFRSIQGNEGIADVSSSSSTSSSPGQQLFCPISKVPQLCEALGAPLPLLATIQHRLVAMAAGGDGEGGGRSGGGGGGGPAIHQTLLDRFSLHECMQLPLHTVCQILLVEDVMPLPMSARVLLPNGQQRGPAAAAAAAAAAGGASAAVAPVAASSKLHHASIASAASSPFLFTPLSSPTSYLQSLVSCSALQAGEHLQVQDGIGTPVRSTLPHHLARLGEEWLLANKRAAYEIAEKGSAACAREVFGFLSHEGDWLGAAAVHLHNERLGSASAMFGSDGGGTTTTAAAAGERLPGNASSSSSAGGHSVTPLSIVAFTSLLAYLAPVTHPYNELATEAIDTQTPSPSSTNEGGGGGGGGGGSSSSGSHHSNPVISAGIISFLNANRVAQSLAVSQGGHTIASSRFFSWILNDSEGVAVGKGPGSLSAGGDSVTAVSGKSDQLTTDADSTTDIIACMAAQARIEDNTGVTKPSESFLAAPPSHPCRLGGGKDGSKRSEGRRKDNTPVSGLNPAVEERVTEEQEAFLRNASQIPLEKLPFVPGNPAVPGEVTGTEYNGKFGLGVYRMTVLKHLWKILLGELAEARKEKTMATTQNSKVKEPKNSNGTNAAETPFEAERRQRDARNVHAEAHRYARRVAAEMISHALEVYERFKTYESHGTLWSRHQKMLFAVPAGTHRRYTRRLADLRAASSEQVPLYNLLVSSSWLGCDKKFHQAPMWDALQNSKVFEAGAVCLSTSPAQLQFAISAFAASRNKHMLFSTSVKYPFNPLKRTNKDIFYFDFRLTQHAQILLAAHYTHMMSAKTHFQMLKSATATVATFLFPFALGGRTFMNFLPHHSQLEGSPASAKRGETQATAAAPTEGEGGHAGGWHNNSNKRINPIDPVPLTNLRKNAQQQGAGGGTTGTVQALAGGAGAGGNTNATTPFAHMAPPAMPEDHTSDVPSIAFCFPFVKWKPNCPPMSDPLSGVGGGGGTFSQQALLADAEKAAAEAINSRLTPHDEEIYVAPSVCTLIQQSESVASYVNKQFVPCVEQHLKQPYKSREMASLQAAIQEHNKTNTSEQTHHRHQQQFDNNNDNNNQELHHQQQHHPEESATGNGRSGQEEEADADEDAKWIRETTREVKELEANCASLFQQLHKTGIVQRTMYLSGFTQGGNGAASTSASASSSTAAPPSTTSSAATNATKSGQQNAPSPSPIDTAIALRPNIDMAAVHRRMKFLDERGELLRRIQKNEGQLGELQQDGKEALELRNQLVAELEKFKLESKRKLKETHSSTQTYIDETARSYAHRLQMARNREKKRVAVLEQSCASFLEELDELNQRWDEKQAALPAEVRRVEKLLQKVKRDAELSSLSPIGQWHSLEKNPASPANNQQSRHGAPTSTQYGRTYTPIAVVDVIGGEGMMATMAQQQGEESPSQRKRRLLLEGVLDSDDSSFDEDSDADADPLKLMRQHRSVSGRQSVETGSVAGEEPSLLDRPLEEDQQDQQPAGSGSASVAPTTPSQREETPQKPRRSRRGSAVSIVTHNEAEDGTTAKSTATGGGRGMRLKTTQKKHRGAATASSAGSSLHQPRFTSGGTAVRCISIADYIALANTRQSSLLQLGGSTHGHGIGGQPQPFASAWMEPGSTNGHSNMNAAFDDTEPSHADDLARISKEVLHVGAVHGWVMPVPAAAGGGSGGGGGGGAPTQPLPAPAPGAALQGQGRGAHGDDSLVTLRCTLRRDW